MEIKNEKVAAYVRASMPGLDVTLVKQQANLIKYAETHNLFIVEWYIDTGLSAKEPVENRPALKKMTLDAEDGKFDRIIFVKENRLFNSVEAYNNYVERVSPVVCTATEESNLLKYARELQL